MADEAADRVDIPDVALRSALAFAVKVALGNSRKKPPVAVPAKVRPLLGQTKVRPAGLSVVRHVLESDDAFRADVAGRATADHVDEIGRLWLQRPDGWAERIAAVLQADEQPSDTGGSVALKKAERLRAAAEKRSGLAEKERDVAKDDLARAERRLTELEAERERLADKVASLTQQVKELEAANRSHRSKSSAAEHRSQVGAHEVEQLRVRLKEAEAARDRALEDWSSRREPVELGELRSLLERAAAMVAPEPSLTAKRSPRPIPGRLHGDELGEAEHLLRVDGVEVLVDGYNVAKQAWPGLDLRRQRERLIDSCETLAKRFFTKITIVFDGQDLVGASADGRRLVRVVFTSSGELADDRLRAMVRSLPASVPVVVVTSDEEVRSSVKRMGANLLRNHVLPDLARR